MKRILFLVTILFLTISSRSIYGQTFENKEAEKRVEGSKLVRMDEHNRNIKFIQLRSDYYHTASDQPNWLNKSLKFSKHHQAKILRKETDKIGFTHSKYQVYFKNIPVEGAVYTVHASEGKINSASGEYIPGQDISVTPKTSEREAFNCAIRYVNATRYKWESTDNPRPVGELTILPMDSTYVLTYKFDIYATEPLSRQYIFVDANGGTIVKAFNRIHVIDAIGTAKTMYNGNVTFTTDSYNGSYRLRESGRGSGIETYNLNHSTSYSTATDFIDADNNWTDTIDYNHAANDAHYGTEATYDYYFTKFGRNSYDNNGAKIISYVHYSRNYVNAFWDGTCMTYGDGDGVTYLPLTPIEVVAHEITHGVTEHSAGLIYSGESGALNESFSDIFGVVIDFFKNPTRANYLMGDAMSTTHTPFRSMQNPNDYGDPGTYKGLYWDPYQEVHTNSGVQNHWFYLLCEGGVGTNELGNSYNIAGIGRDKAAKIAYRSLTVYLTPSSNYADARFYSIQSAIDLFGDCSPEVIAVTNAWYAVGVGLQYNNSVVADFITSKTSACNTPATICFYNRSSRASAYSWDFGDGSRDTARQPVHTYVGTGSYTARLIATGNTLCNNSDTAEKVISITQNSSIIAPSCLPHTLNPGTGGIYSFQFNTINKATNGSIDNYQDYSCSDTTYITEGKKYKLSIKIGNDNLENVYIWVDLNNNGTFDDGELIYQKKNVSRTLTDSIIFPGGAQYNVPLRVRVGTDYSTYTLPNACTDSRNGQYQDYAINVRQNSSSPLVMFTSSKKNIVSGDTVQFKDNSLNLPTSWTWNFPGGSPSYSSLQNPKVAYSTPGIYDVTLTASNTSGSNAVIKTGYITVSTPSPVGLTASLKNQANGAVSLKWYTQNDDNVYEDFDDGVADNIIYSDTCFVVENGYLKASGAGDAEWKNAMYERDFQDFLLEYKFQQQQGASYSIGTFLRAQGTMNNSDANGYLINVVPSGAYSAWKLVNGTATNILPWQTSTAINTATGAWNTVSVEAVGSNIKIYVNGQFVDEFTDNTYSSGRINLGCYFGQGYTFDIRWDYMNIITTNTSINNQNLIKAINTILPDNGDFTKPPLITINKNVVESKSLIPQVTNIQGTNVFKYYKVYRDSVLLKTTSNKSLNDTLPKYGTYKYFVTALYDEGESGPSNKVSLKWDEINPGDNCLNAQSLAGLTSPYSSSTLGYNTDFTVCNMGYSPDRIFYIDVPNGNQLKIGLTYSGFDSRHSIRVGGSCPGTTEIACVDNPDVQMHSYSNTSGSTQRVYFILAGYGSGYGNFTLAWDLQAPALPKADLSADQTFIATGTAVNFTDLSKGIPTSWKWTFQGGTPSTSPSQNPIVTYNTLGSYEVKLVASNTFGSDSIVKTGYITVSNLIYCKSNLGGQGSCPGDITGVSIKGSALNNTSHTNCNLLNGSTYASYPPTGNNTATLKADTTYELSVTSSSSDIISVWIDYDQNGVFDASEWNQVTTISTPGVPSKVNVAIPSSAMAGKTGMRIRSRASGNPNGSGDACSSFGSGITEDYFITIAQVPKKPTANFTAKQSVIVGENVQFADISGGVPTTWQWSFPGGTPSTSTLQHPVVSYNAAGTYHVKLRVTNALGTDSIAKTNYITAVNALPGEECGNAQNLATLTSPYSGTTAGYKNDFTLCYSGSSPDRIFYIDVPNGNTLKIGQLSNNFDSQHTIRVGGSCPGTTLLYCVDEPDTQIHTYTNTTGSTQRVYYILGGYGSSSYGNFILSWQLIAPSIPVASFTSDKTVIQMGNYINFTDQSTGIPTSWNWYFSGGNPSTSNISNPSVLYNTPGTYKVKLIVSNSLGSDSIVKTNYITVTYPPKPIANFYSGSNIVTVGTSVYFYDNSSNSPTSWKWTFSGGTPSSSTSSYQYVTYNAPGIYDVKLGVSNAGGSDSITKKGYITVMPIPKPVANFYADVTNITATSYVNFHDNSANTPTSWKWTFTGGMPSSSTSSYPSVQYNTSGIYAVKLVVSNNGGSDSITKTGYITVMLPPKPVANFSTSATTILTGTTVYFSDISTQSPTSRKWTFTGGSPATSTYNNPYVTYNTVGNYDVKLVVSNAGGSDSITKPGLINVVTSLPGDKCNNAQDLSQLTSPYSSSTTSYKSDFTYCYMSSPDRIFYIDVANGVTLNIGQISNDFDSRHTIRLGGSCPGTTELYCVDDPDTQIHTYTNTTGSVQRVYYILGGVGSSSGNFTLAWRLSTSAKPVANFIADNTNIPSSNYIYFTDQSSGIPTSWNWSFPGGSPSYSSSSAPSIYYSTPGTYNVKLIVSNSYGKDSISKNGYITVGGSTKPVADFYASSTKVTTGSYVYFYSSSTNSPTSYKWTFTGGTPSSSSSNYPYVIYNSPGLYTVKLVVSNAAGSDSVVKTQYMTVTSLPKPVANFYVSNNNVIIGNSVTFYSNSGNNPTSFKWTFTGGTPPTSTYSSTYVTYNTTGTYPVKLVVANASGSDSITKTDFITVSLPPKPVASFYADITNAVVGTYINFTDNSVNNPTSRKWTFTGGSPSMSTSSYPSVVYNTPGTYSVKLVVANAGGKDSITKTGYITIVPQPKPVADFYASSTSAVIGSYIYFYNNSLNSPTTWKWTFTGGSPSTSTYNNPSVLYNNAGTYTVKLVVSNAGGSDSITKTGYITITLPPKPVASFTSNVTNITAGTIVSFSDNSQYTPTSWKWTFTGGTPASSTLRNPNVAYNNTGTFDVKLVATNAYGSDSIIKQGYINVLRFLYCTSNLGGSGSCPGDINLVSITGTTLNNSSHNNCSTNNNSTYASYPSTATLDAGSTYELGVTTSSTDIISVWIDYNQNGTFEASEWNQVTTSSTPNLVSKINFIVPASALTGRTVMRIRSRSSGNSNGSGDACSNFGSGITEDYTVNIANNTAQFKADTTVICKNSMVKFTKTGTQATTYAWDFGDGASPKTANTVGPHYISYSTPGYKTISLVANGITLTKTNYINILNSPSRLVVSAPSSYCAGNPVSITLSGSEADTKYSLFANDIDLNLSVSGTGSGLIWNNRTAGIYRIFGRKDNGCGIYVTDTFKISEQPIPSAPEVYQNQNQLYSRIENGNQWYSREDGLLTGATSNVYEPLHNGNYYAIVTANGCSSSTSNTINFIVNGTNEITGNNPVTFYPNPFTSILYIKTTQGLVINKIEIRNILGGIITSITPEINKDLLYPIDMANQANGYYTVVLFTDKGMLTYKVMKVE